MKTPFIALTLAIAAVAPAAPALAHHSGAMFEPTLQRELHGTIKQFKWSNPHAWIEIDVADEESGETVMWAVEMTAPNNLMRTGWNRRTLQSGDEVVLTIRPLRDGQPGGTFVRVTTPDGVAMPPRVEAAVAGPIPGGETTASAAEHGEPTTSEETPGDGPVE